VLRETAGGRQNLPPGPPLGCLLSLWVVSPDAEVQVDPAALLLHLVNLALAIRLAASLEREQLQRVVYRKRPPEFCMFSRGGSRDGCAPVAALTPRPLLGSRVKWVPAPSVGQSGITRPPPSRRVGSLQTRSGVPGGGTPSVPALSTPVDTGRVVGVGAW
jgi:hypothetical protein